MLAGIEGRVERILRRRRPPLDLSEATITHASPCPTSRKVAVRVRSKLRQTCRRVIDPTKTTTDTSATVRAYGRKAPARIAQHTNKPFPEASARRHEKTGPTRRTNERTPRKQSSACQPAKQRKTDPSPFQPDDTAPNRPVGTIPSSESGTTTRSDKKIPPGENCEKCQMAIGAVAKMAVTRGNRAETPHPSTYLMQPGST